MRRFGLYIHTLRYLKLQQIIYQVYIRFKHTRISSTTAPILRKKVRNFLPPSSHRISLLDENTFFFLNQPGDLSIVGWDDFKKPKLVSKLWRYNQHYFDDLNAANSKIRVNWHHQLIKHWIDNNPPGSTIGWDPYPTSLRIVNWTKWFLMGNLPSKENLQSLFIQTRWLRKNLEYHILGNHLFANAKALIFAGAFFSGREADQWIKKGINIISEQLNEQILTDGGNFELSTMYHSIFLEDVLDLINLSSVYPLLFPAEIVLSLKEVAIKMLEWLNCMIHPDGEIALFNDAGIGTSPCPSQLFLYAKRININFDKNVKLLNHLDASGYIRVERSNMVTFLDVGLIGPDYLPGHAHADSLSFEMSLFGTRVFVNGGTSEYETDYIRQEERGTGSHNTVVINDENSSEIWSSFRVARRAYPFNLNIIEESDFLSISCCHDGYKRLNGKPVHKRTWNFLDSELIIEDKISGAYFSANAYFHINPQIPISNKDPQNWVLFLPDGQEVFIEVDKGKVNLMDSYYSPEFGKRIPAKALKISFTESSVRLKIKWTHDV